MFRQFIHKIEISLLILLLCLGVGVSSIGVTLCRYQVTHENFVMFIVKGEGEFYVVSENPNWIKEENSQDLNLAFSVVNTITDEIPFTSHRFHVRWNSTTEQDISLFVKELSGRENEYKGVLAQSAEGNYHYIFVDEYGSEAWMNLEANEVSEKKLRLEVKNPEHSFGSEIVIVDDSYEIEKQNVFSTAEVAPLTVSSNLLSNTENRIIETTGEINISLISNRNVSSRVYVINENEDITATINQLEEVTVELNANTESTVKLALVKNQIVEDEEIIETETPEVSQEPQTSETPESTEEPINNDEPVVTEEPVVTDQPVDTEETQPMTLMVEESALPELSEDPVETESPVPTATPDQQPTVSPEVTETPIPTETPVPTDTPEDTTSPEPVVTDTPDPTETPESTVTPETSESPDPSATPGASETPETSETPEPTETPEVSAEPEVISSPVTVVWEILNDQDEVIDEYKAVFILKEEKSFDENAVVMMSSENESFNQYEVIDLKLISDLDTAVSIHEGEGFPVNTKYSLDQGKSWHVLTEKSSIQIDLKQNIETSMWINLYDSNQVFENRDYSLIAAMNDVEASQVDLKMEKLEMTVLEILNSSMGIVTNTPGSFTMNTDNVTITLEKFVNNSYELIDKDAYLNWNTEDYLTYQISVKEDTEIPNGNYRIKIAQNISNKTIKECYLTFFAMGGKQE